MRKEGRLFFFEKKNQKTFVFCALLLAAGSNAAAEDAPTKKGEYLFRAADCAACHAGAGGKVSGGRAFTTPFGTIYASNITPDKHAGIGDYTDDEFVSALQQGVGRGGKHLYPAMPYTSYTQMSRDDALAIKTYILTLPASPDIPPANAMTFPFNIRFLMAFWNYLYNPDKRFTPDASHDAAWNRGAYLAEALGHCQQCHTPRNFLQGLQNSKAYAGALQQGWISYNLTSDAKSGVGAWAEADLATYLRTGHADNHGSAAGPMAEAVGYSLRYLTSDDAQALAHFLKTIPAIAGNPAPTETHVAEDTLGRQIFEGACASCHKPDGTGSPTPYAALLGSHTAGDPAATNAVQVIVSGTRLQTSTGEMTMPSSAGGFTDRELAAVANYTIEHFGGRGGHATPEMVKKAREGSSPKVDQPSS